MKSIWLFTLLIGCGANEKRSGFSESISCRWLSPQEGTAFDLGTVSFEIEVDGASQQALVIWSSDIDGPIGETTLSDGNTSTLTPEDISSGSHSITASVVDGDLSCESTASVVLGHAPTVTFTSPDDASTFGQQDTVSVAVQIADLDDEVNQLELNWFVDSVLLETTPVNPDGSSEMEVELFVGAHTIVAEVTDAVGLSGQATMSLNVNGSPVVSTVEIQPDPATTTDDLTAVVESVSDPENDQLVEVVQWFKDDQLTAIDTFDVPSFETQKGETWTFRYAVSDQYSLQVATASLTIENTAPVVSTVSISPGTAVNSISELTCNATVDDPDEIPDLIYVWTNETTGSQLGSGQTLVLNSTLVLPNEAVRCTVTATDSDGVSATGEATVVVEKASPIISGMTIAANGPDLYNDSLAICAASVVDPEGTAITLSFLWYNVSQSTTLGQLTSLQLTSGLAMPGDFIRCEITAIDADGDSSTATAVVQVTNRPPVVVATILPGATVLEGETLYCSGLVSDPDSNALLSPSHGWTNLSTGIQVSSQEDYTVQPSDVGATLECTVTVTDANGATASGTATVFVSAGNVYVIDGTSETWPEGTYTYDGLELVNGATLYVEGDVVIEITGNLFVDATSSIDGNGSGHSVNSSSGSGNGPCSGGWVSGEGASGAGYGGVGGEGGTDSSSSIAAGGCSTGFSDGYGIEKGSSGGSTDSSVGGAGGGSLWVTANHVLIDGIISVDGDPGVGGTGRNGGGGSGGGILLDAVNIEISGYLSAVGGDGGSGTDTANDGGGGGGGGRIKLFSDQQTSFSGGYSVSGGSGGTYGGHQHGQPGSDGSFYLD